MKFYLTVESKEKIKSIFINLNVFYLLDVQEIIKDFGLDMSKPYNRYFVSQEIEKTILAQSKSKRLEGIIYINSDFKPRTVDHLYNLIKDLPKMEGMVLIDDGVFPKLSEYHHMFEEVLFFPSVRRVKILECKTLKPFEEDYRGQDTLKRIKDIDPFVK